MYVFAECLVYTNHKHVAHHVLGTAVGTVPSQTGDWSGARSKRQKENVDSSASGGKSTVETGNNSNLFDSSVVNV